MSSCAFAMTQRPSQRLGEKEHLTGFACRRARYTFAWRFSADGKHLFIVFGSNSNIDTGEDPRRAAVTILCDTTTARMRGCTRRRLRNPVGLALEPVTGAIWTTVNERDELAATIFLRIISPH